jgi:hypothetical protein
VEIVQKRRAESALGSLRREKAGSEDKKKNREKKQGEKDYLKEQELRDDELIDEFDYDKSLSLPK